jgi:roadblock/LC7 domain-containing protein
METTNILEKAYLDWSQYNDQKELKNNFDIIQMMSYIFNKTNDKEWSDKFLSQNPYKMYPEMWFYVYTLIHLELGFKQPIVEHYSVVQKNEFRPYLWFNVTKKGILLKDVAEISFQLFFPNILVNNFKNVKFSHSNLIEVMNASLKILSEIEKDSQLFKLLKTFINMTYGMFSKNHNLLSAEKNIPNEICKISSEIMTNLHKILENKVIYADTDTVYVLNLTNEDRSSMNRFAAVNGFLLSEKNHPYMIIENYKKYITIDDAKIDKQNNTIFGGQLKFKGYRFKQVC